MARRRLGANEQGRHKDLSYQEWQGRNATASIFAFYSPIEIMLLRHGLVKRAKLKAREKGKWTLAFGYVAEQQTLVAA